MKKAFFPNHIITAALLLTAGLAASCKKLIEIPPNPPTEIGSAAQFADSASAMSAVAFVYSYASNTTSGFGYGDALLPEATGLSSDELLSPNNYDSYMLQFYSYGLTNVNSDVASLWTSPYTSLYDVNALTDGA